jgi:hypothetical protein
MPAGRTVDADHTHARYDPGARILQAASMDVKRTALKYSGESDGRP